MNTIDSCQGQERDIVIISIARTRGIGFLAIRQRLNVALTRAKKMLILCGNFNSLQVCSFLIESYFFFKLFCLYRCRITQCGRVCWTMPEIVNFTFIHQKWMILPWILILKRHWLPDFLFNLLCWINIILIVFTFARFFEHFDWNIKEVSGPKFLQNSPDPNFHNWTLNVLGPI